jgi:Transposase domain (DUF772)
VVLVKLALLGWLSGITRERRLADEGRLNLAWRWFLGYDLDERRPDHAVLSKARRRLGVTVDQACCAEIVRQCERAGRIRGDRRYLDSPLVEATAGLESLGSRALVAPPAAADRAPAGAPEPVPVLAPPPEPRRPHVAGPRDPPNGRPGRANERVVSRTDPAAGLVARAGVPLDRSHTVAGGVAGGPARSITAVDVTPAAVADADLLERLRKEHEGATGRTATAVVADAKAGTAASYRALEEDGIRASIPPHLGRERRGRSPTRGSSPTRPATAACARRGRCCAARAARAALGRAAGASLVPRRKSAAPARSEPTAAGRPRRGRSPDRTTAGWTTGPAPTGGPRTPSGAAGGGRAGPRRCWPKRRRATACGAPTSGAVPRSASRRSGRRGPTTASRWSAGTADGRRRRPRRSDSAGRPRSAAFPSPSAPSGLSASMATPLATPDVSTRP